MPGSSYRPTKRSLAIARIANTPRHERAFAVRPFLFIVYRYFEAITRKNASLDRYTRIELALEPWAGSRYVGRHVAE